MDIIIRKDITYKLLGKHSAARTDYHYLIHHLSPPMLFF